MAEEIKKVKISHAAQHGNPLMDEYAVQEALRYHRDIVICCEYRDMHPESDEDDEDPENREALGRAEKKREAWKKQNVIGSRIHAASEAVGKLLAGCSAVTSAGDLGDFFESTLKPWELVNIVAEYLKSQGVEAEIMRGDCEGEGDFDCFVQNVESNSYVDPSEYEPVSWSSSLRAHLNNSDDGPGKSQYVDCSCRCSSCRTGSHCCGEECRCNPDE